MTTWTPSTLAANLVPKVAYNVRLADGSLARAYAFGGFWHVVCENGEEVEHLQLMDLCRWLEAAGAVSLANRP